MRRSELSIARLLATVLLVLSVCGCTAAGSHRSAPLQEVKVLQITQDGRPAAYPQRWVRNTLLVDLQGVTGSGRIVLRPQQGNVWPVRLALKVSAGSVGVLEVMADQRSVLPITQAAGKPVELTLDPGLYAPGTEQIAVLWRPATAATP
jgi:hypothetical protein